MTGSLLPTQLAGTRTLFDDTVEVLGGLRAGQRRGALRPQVRTAQIGQPHRQLVVGHRDLAVHRAVDDRDRRAPVALAAQQPVAQGHALLEGAEGDVGRLRAIGFGGGGRLGRALIEHMAKVGWKMASGNGHRSGFVRIVPASPLQQCRPGRTPEPTPLGAGDQLAISNSFGFGGHNNVLVVAAGSGPEA